MKVFTFYYNRYENASTSKALRENNIDHIILVHNDEQKTKFINGGTIYGDIKVTGNGKGLAYQRNSALDMMSAGEWAVFMCDDFKEIRSLKKEWILSNNNELPITFKNQEIFRLKKENIITLNEMFSIFPKLIDLAEKNNIYLIGFGLHSNPQNLKKKFTNKGLADGRFWLVKKSNYKFDINAQLIDDVAWTAENLVRHGKVLVLNWIVPFFERYTAGGFGSTEERKEQRKKECIYLSSKFFPLVQIADKTNWDYGTHIRIYGSDGNIIKARRRLLH